MANKDFSILKWIIFPPIVLGLSVGIAFFNIDIFGLRGSVLYLIALGAVNLSSMVMLRSSSSAKRQVRIAAFSFECLMIAALLINISYSLSAQRDLSLVARGGEDRRAEIAEIGRLRSRRAQADLAKQLGAREDVRGAFGRYEAVLFWVMVSELGLALGGLVTVYGLSSLRSGLRRIPRGAFRGARPIMRESFPGAFSAAIQAERGSQIGFAPLKPPEANLKQPEALLKRTEEASGNFDNRPSGVLAGELRVIGQGSGLRVYDRNQYLGHIAWTRYLAGVVDPQRPTQGEIEALMMGDGR